MQAAHAAIELESLEQLASAAFDHPADAPAIEFNKEWICWGGISNLASQIARLLADYQIQPGAKVALIARNHPAVIVGFVALLTARLNVRMIYPYQSANGIATAIKECQPNAVVALAEDFTGPVREVMGKYSLAAIAMNDLTAHGIETLEGKFPHTGSTDNLSIELLTSGTTGKPKPFLMRYDSIAKDLLAARSQTSVVHKREINQEPALLYFPISNISGLYSTLPAILSGRRIVLLERFTIAGWHDFVVRYRPMISGLPPAGIQMVLDADIPREDLSSIRMIGAGAAPLDPAVQRAFEERYGIPILLSYGATEFGGPVTRMTLDQYENGGKYKIGSVGKAIQGAKLRVVDPHTDTVLPPEKEGILEVVSPRIGDDWIRTTDIAVIDKDGYLFIHGRADGAINRGGFKILPETVEQALLQHPAIAMAAVVGIPDHTLGQVPAAAVVLKAGHASVTESDLQGFLRERLLATHIPTRWCFVEELPRTNLSYKVSQSAVRALFE